MQFRAIQPNIEVFGHALSFTISGFRLLPSVGLRYLQRFGLAQRGPDGKPTLDLEAWYSQAKWLQCFEAIYQEVGPNTTMEMGRQLGLGYPLPPNMRELHAALAWLDPGYHLA